MSKLFGLVGILWIGVSTAALAQLDDEQFFMYVASHAEENPAGIGLYKFDASDGSLTFLKAFNNPADAAYLAVGPNGQNVFSIHRGPSGGLVSAYYVDQQSGDLSFVNRRSTLGNGPCYVSVDSSGKFLFNANYAAGNVSSFHIEEQGFIGSPVSNIFHNGSSVNPDRQQGPHPHMILPAPEGDLVVVPDLGIDKIMVYELKDDGHLAPAYSPFADVDPGAGPRHFAFHPSMQYGYVLNELHASVTGFNLDKSTGKLETSQTVGILPDNFEGKNKSADIVITPDGQYLYATNRGHNSIAKIAIDTSSGKMTMLGTQSCGGDWPRAFVIDPTGKYLIVGNMYSGNTVVFKIDYATGNLEQVGEDTNFFGTQSLKFLPK